jgi:quercetin dioxygenase-like cupin family protein
MRNRLVLGLVATMLAVGVGGAAGSHVVTVDPNAVPPGYLAAHNDVAGIKINSFARVVKNGHADATIRHFVFGPNVATGWHTHPGPAIVTVVSGTFSYQDAHGNECRTRTYTAGQGFFDPGFGHVHRGIAGPSGAHLYTLFLSPTGAPNETIPTAAPPECS